MDILSLVKKYESRGPRYTSYPTALYFSDATSAQELQAAALADARDVSLYIHIPFCASLCRFCGCSSSVCTDPRKADEYIGLLKRELELWRDAGFGRRKVGQIHFGGGTPNFLLPEQIDRLNSLIEEFFQKDEDLEFSVELDPRTLTRQKVKAFARAGVNRASLGVQDTSEKTQKAVGRIQPQETNLAAVAYLRESGIDRINIDLMYGLPFQDRESFSRTLDDALALSPSRLALFNYAHVPWMKAAQKSLEKFGLPDAETKVGLFTQAMEFLEGAGFEYLGLDHFALPDDELVRARRDGSLHRNFQGYSTRGALTSFAIGLTSISQTQDTYRQNHKDMPSYARSLGEGRIPTARGIKLSKEDMLRRKIIMDLMCLLKIRYADYPCDFKAKFSLALEKLKGFQVDGLVSLSPDGFEITKTGRIFLRDVAMLFDAYLSDPTKRYSKTV